MADVEVCSYDRAVVYDQAVAMFDFHARSDLGSGTQFDAQDVLDNDAIYDHQGDAKPPQKGMFASGQPVDQSKKGEDKDNLHLSLVVVVILKDISKHAHLSPAKAAVGVVSNSIKMRIVTAIRNDKTRPILRQSER